MTSAVRVVLIGMMGAGKTSIGEALAERLAWPFTDTDDVIVARTGSSIPDVFARDGEVGFRRIESEVVAQTLHLPGPRVVAVGGGAVVDPANRACLAERATVVWLRASPSTLAERVGTGNGRPMLSDPGALERLLAVRAPLYEEAASVIVDVDGSSVDEVADRLASAVEARHV